MKTDIFDSPACQLLSGVDSLYLTGSFNQDDPNFKKIGSVFDSLEKLKVQAREKKEPQLLQVYQDQVFVHGHGTKFYSYILQTQYFQIQISPFISKSIPSLNIQIRSFSLWKLGLYGSVQALETLLYSLGLFGPFNLKPSRLDLCADVESENFLPFITSYAKHRARQQQQVTDCDNLLYLRIGKGDVQVRFYDKVKEIKVSQKLWFFDLWKKSPDDYSQDFSIYRIEFQLRRKALKSLSINCMEDLYQNLEKLWSYLTGDWFKLVYNQKDRHKSREKITPFWLSIQTAFTGMKEQTLERKEFATEIDGKQLSLAMVGMVLKYATYHYQDYQTDLTQIKIDEKEFINLCKVMLNKSGLIADELTKSFLLKI